MKTREKENSTGMSIRLNKKEWEEIKTNGETLFENREIGYMQVVPNSITFETTSPFYKDKKELDIQNKEKSAEELATEKEVKAEISKKVK